MQLSPRMKLISEALLENSRVGSVKATCLYNRMQSLQVLWNPDVQARLPFEAEDEEMVKWEVGLLTDAVKDLEELMLAVNQIKNGTKALLKDRERDASEKKTGRKIVT
jgi:hypothetical protein